MVVQGTAGRVSCQCDMVRQAWCTKLVLGLEARLVEYGLVAAKAAQEQTVKENVLDLEWVCGGGRDSGIWAGGRQGRPGANC